MPTMNERDPKRGRRRPTTKLKVKDQKRIQEKIMIMTLNFSFALSSCWSSWVTTRHERRGRERKRGRRRGRRRRRRRK